MKIRPVTALVTLLLLLGLPVELRADVNGFSIFKVANYPQTNASQPASLTQPNAYYFGAQLGSDTNMMYGGTNASLVTNAYFFTPDGFQYFMSSSDNFYYFYGSPYFTNQAGLDAAFISGFYEIDINDGVDSGDLFVPTNSLYSADIPYFTGSTWTNMQSLNPARPFDLTWNNFTPSPGATEAFIFVRIFDSDGNTPYTTNFISPGILSAQIPANTLDLDTAYTIQIFFSDRTNEPASGFLSETTGVVGFDNLTTTTLTTIAEPTLTITPAGTNVIISWPLSAADFNVQATVRTPPNNGWYFMSNFTAVIGQRIVLTNPIASGVEFFRLQQFGQ